MRLSVLSFLLIRTLASLSIERIPSTNPPPVPRIYPLMNSFPSLNLISVFGGYYQLDSEYNDLWVFNVTTSLWRRLAAADDVYPASRYNGGSFADLSANILYVFGGMTESGLLNDLWSFQMESCMWNKIITSGDIPYPRSRFAYTSYISGGVLFFAVFGGLTSIESDNELFTLDTSKWVWTNLPKQGVVPQKALGASLFYYEGFLFLAAGEAIYDGYPYAQAFYKYDLSSLEWTNITSVQTYTSRMLQGSILFDKAAFLLTGWSSKLNNVSEDWYMVNLTSTDYNWVKIPVTSNSSQDYTSIYNYGLTLYNSQLYSFGGISNSNTLNCLLVFDLSKSPITYNFYPNDISPSPRMYHSMQNVGKYLLLFGGRADNSALLSDLWAYDTSLESWHIIQATGSIPSARYGHGSSSYADTMAVWGGQNDDGYLNDGFIFDATTSSWSSLPTSENSPSPRKGACIILHETSLMIFGGVTNSGLSDEFWTYDLVTSTYTLIDSQNSGGPGPLAYCSCRVSTTSNDIVYIMYGEGDSEMPLNEFYSINITNSTWRKYYDDRADLSWSRKGTFAFKLKSRVIVAGGESNNFVPKSEIFYFNTSSADHTQIGNLPNFIFAAAYSYFQNYIYIHGGASTLGQILRHEVPTNRFFKIDLMSDCEEISECYWKCSPGSMRTSSCEICPPGTYSDVYDSTTCQKCDAGKYNPNYGASTNGMCYPCEENTYSRKPGAAYCLDCPGGATCIPGSSSYSVQENSYQDDSVQPSIFQGNNGEYRKYTLITQLTIGLIGLALIVVLLILNQKKKFLISIDLYSASHNHFVNQVMYLKQSSLGGIFSIVFMVLAVMIICNGIAGYIVNNVVEVKSLVPLVVLENEVSRFESNLTIVAILLNYGGACLVNDTCSPEIAYSISNVDGVWSSFSCKFYNSDCFTELSCSRCTINSQATISYAMNNYIGYTSGFLTNVTSTSSIPSQSSSYSTYILPDSNRIFLGSKPSIAYYTMIPSYYRKFQNDETYTGYHSTLESSSVKGSQFRTYETGLASNSYLDIVLTVSSNGLYTTRDNIQSFGIFISTLLGSVFGIMSSVGAIMKILESYWLTYEQKKNSKEKFSNIAESGSLSYQSCQHPSSKRETCNIIKDDNATIEKFWPDQEQFI
ncbi:unnamed protein product [Blepharisma stoltei]|uniref:Tyrosine-protein kinase ephrin type A/B receptor-like domain-containing protein n=1 Tax=Blepharisma stoltei TaxID=1481888 RepID=A0AAU9IZK3_9CILI|nr:unnamed protein product [Blepharisma stoltei]